MAFSKPHLVQWSRGFEQDSPKIIPSRGLGLHWPFSVKPTMIPIEFGGSGLKFACKVSNLFIYLQLLASIIHLLIRLPLGRRKGKSMHDDCPPYYTSNLQSRTSRPLPFSLHSRFSLLIYNVNTGEGVF